MAVQVPHIPPCETLDELRMAIVRAFTEVTQAQAEMAEVELRPRAVAPDHPREGMLVYADGVNFDPGDGEGTYEYKNGVWAPLFQEPLDGTTIDDLTLTDPDLVNPSLAGTISHTVGAILDWDTQALVTAAGTSTAGAATVNKMAGKVRTTSMAVTPLNSYILTISNTQVLAAGLVFASIAPVAITSGLPILISVTPGAGNVIISIFNLSSTLNLLGTMDVSFFVGR